MPKITTTSVEMTCLQGLADLVRIEGPWLKSIAGGDPEEAAVILRLLLAQMTTTSKRLLGAMVLDRLDVETDAVERASLRQGDTHLQSGPAALNGTTFTLFRGYPGRPLNPTIELWLEK